MNHVILVVAVLVMAVAIAVGIAWSNQSILNRPQRILFSESKIEIVPVNKPWPIWLVAIMAAVGFLLNRDVASLAWCLLMGYLALTIVNEKTVVSKHGISRLTGLWKFQKAKTYEYSSIGNIKVEALKTKTTASAMTVVLNRHITRVVTNGSPGDVKKLVSAIDGWKEAAAVDPKAIKPIQCGLVCWSGSSEHPKVSPYGISTICLQVC
jgi:hypothetical protein